MRLDDGRVMTEFITAALAGRPLRLDAAGEQTRSFCFIDDMVEGLMALMSFDGNPGPVNLGSADEVKLSQLAELVVAMAGSPSAIMQAPRRLDDPMQRKPDTVLATAVLGWRPQIKLAVGLEMLIRSIRKISTQ